MIYIAPWEGALESLCLQQSFTWDAFGVHESKALQFCEKSFYIYDTFSILRVTSGNRGVKTYHDMITVRKLDLTFLKVEPLEVVVLMCRLGCFTVRLPCLCLITRAPCVASKGAQTSS